jgi:hypothetical protein
VPTTSNIFAHVIGALEQAGIPYMLTGSFASSYHGIPRATQDIDIVISPTADQIRALVSLLPKTEYYVDEEAALDALKREGQFNLVDIDTGWKIDLMIRRSRPFSRQEFDRREAVEFQGIQLVVATAEDIFLAKLEWAKLGGSQRQIEDAAGILRIRREDLDRDYLRRWVEELDLTAQWEEARKAAGITD